MTNPADIAKPFYSSSLKKQDRWRLTCSFSDCSVPHKVEPLYSQDTMKALVSENIPSLFFADSSCPCFRSIEQGGYHKGIVNMPFCL